MLRFIAICGVGVIRRIEFGPTSTVELWLVWLFDDFIELFFQAQYATDSEFTIKSSKVMLAQAGMGSAGLTNSLCYLRN
jgi:hypothetical protein